MANLPAYCNSCGFVYPSGIELKYALDIRMSNNQVQCPRCGAMGRIPDGTYNVLGNAIHVLASTQRSASDLRKLADAIQRARDNNASPEEIKRTIKEQAPELRSLADTLPQTRNELYAAITLLCTVILTVATVIGLYANRGLSSEQIEEI